MSTRVHAQVPSAPATITTGHSPMVQRQCACGGSAGPTGECEGCQEKKLAAAPAGGTGASTGMPALRISSPSDAGEKEAERTADAVMRMADDAPPPTIGSGREELQRQEDTEQAAPSGDESMGEEPTEENLRLMEESNVSPSLEAGAASPGPAGAPLSRALAGAGGGSPLSASARGFMERRFGHDFSRVRVHNDDSAHRAARSIRARAFTHGQRIFFARGHYAPDTPSGRHLLAHELTHTVQQAGGIAPALVQRSFCPAACATPVAAGRLCRAARVRREELGESDATTASNKISHIRVLLDTYKVHLFWNGAPRTNTGTKEEIDCTPNRSRTPQGWDKIGQKCGENHTSYERYNMAYFTGFRSTGFNVGFHNSQPVAAYPTHSHGCVRVSCENARKIRDNTKSNWTSIMVRNSAPGD
ncbi:MAG: DUF4157 domain-containing protein [Acidobacteria bacterium]|nr:DUF4157 domain-containing protein [Acidobacteriota bacterium]